MRANPPDNPLSRIEGPDPKEWEALNTQNAKARCPSCGSKLFYPGPQGGGTINVKCVGCGKYWNYLGAPFGFEPIESEDRYFNLLKGRKLEDL